MPLASRRRATILAMVGALSTWSFAARADDKEACIQGAEQGYALKRDNKLVAAKKLLQTCAGPTCPGALAPSCVEWLAEVEAALPTVVVAAQDEAGHDVRSVAVYSDGQLVAKEIDGTPIPLDPGPHELRFELAGHASRRLDVVIRAGEKNRALRVRFEGGPPSASGKPRGPTAPTPASRGPAIASLVIGGMSLDLAIVTGVIALVAKNELDDQCPTRETCPESERDTIERAKTTALVSTIALPVGAVGIGIGALLLALSTPKKPAARPTTISTFSIEPWLGGGAGGVRGHF